MNEKVSIDKFKVIEQNEGIHVLKVVERNKCVDPYIFFLLSKCNRYQSQNKKKTPLNPFSTKKIIFLTRKKCLSSCLLRYF